MASRHRIAALSAVAMASALVLAVALACSRWVERGARTSGQRARRPHPRFAVSLVADHFQRGNIHTHSTRSDGTASLEAMVGWYRDHGYQFVAMTEHHVRLDPSELEPLSAPGFVVIPGEEVTNSWGRGGDEHPLHANALCAGATLADGERFDHADQGLSAMLAAIRAQGGVPLINHPNYGWALDADDIVHGASGRYLLEIWSGLPAVEAEGDLIHRSEESKWNDVLASDTDAIPVAVDDAHGDHEGDGGSDALPGRGWVETFGRETSVAAICAALAEGRLFASSGPSFARLAVQGDTFAVATTDAAATIDFVGEGGAVLLQVHTADVPARDGVREVPYRLAGDELWVRARIADARGHHAWTAAYRVAD